MARTSRCYNRPSVRDSQPRLRAAAFLSSFDRFTVPPLIVPIHDELGISVGAAAIVASAYFVTYGASQPLWGLLADRLGRVRIIRTAIAVGGLAALVAAVAPGLAVLVAARALAGLCFGAVVPTTITYLGDAVAFRERTHALALLTASATAGMTAGAVASGIAAQLLGWRWAFVLPALLSLPVAVAMWRVPEPGTGEPRRPLGQRLGAVVRERWVAVVLAIALVEGAVIFGSVTFVAAALQKEGVGAALAASAAAGFGLANVLGTPIITRAIRRHSGGALVARGAACAAAGLLLAGVHLTVLTALVATLALGFGFGLLHSTMQAWATQVTPEARAVTVSFFAGALFTGGALATAAAGPLADDERFGTIFLLGAAGAALIATAGAALRSRYETAARRDPSSPASTPSRTGGVKR